MEHPLIEAIKLRDKAKKNKAHPKLIGNLEKRIKDEAKASMKILEKGFPETIRGLYAGEVLTLK